MIWMDVDAALAEVPVNYVALIDDTDFKTREESVAYNQSGMDLVWNFITTAGAYTQTAVTPTTGGVYDWTNQGNGMYSIEIPASGGASINNDTEGFGWFTGFATGILPWTGPMIGFRPAALNNALVDGGDSLDVNVTEISGDSTAADNLEADYDGTGYAKTNSTIGTTTTNTDMRGTDSAALASALSTHDGKLDTVDGIVDELKVAVITNAAGADIAADVAAVKAETANIVADTNELQTDNIPGTLATIDGKIDAQDLIITEARLAELDAANLPADVAAIPTSAEVNAEVVDCLNVDTYAEPGQGAPAATNSIVGKLGYVFKFLRNKIVTSATEIDVFNDAGAVVDQKSTISDDGTDFTRGEFVSGP